MNLLLKSWLPTLPAATILNELAPENSLMSIRTATFCLLLTSLAFTTPISAQEDLRWKFQSGETLKYVVQQKMQTEMKLNGMTVNQTMQQSMDMSWKVAAVTPAGDAAVSQSIDRVQMKMEGPPLGTIQFDTNSTEVSTNPGVKIMADVFRKIIGQEFRVTMKSTGKVENVEVPATLLQAIKETAAGAAGVLTEDMLKQMMEQSSVVLPTAPVTQGQSWESTQEVLLPIGLMKVKSQMTFEGRDSATGLAKIAMKPSITVTPNENAPQKLTLKKTDGLGYVFFDSAKGRISRSELDLTLHMQVMQQGQVIDQVVQQKTTMTLTP